MTNEQIQKYVELKKRKNHPTNIHFKDRDTVTGLFIRDVDYSELKSKNLWRIVSSTKLQEWKQTHDTNLSRIFNGVSFTRLSDEV